MRLILFAILASAPLTGFSQDESLLSYIKKSAIDPRVAMQAERELTLLRTPVREFLQAIEANDLSHQEQAAALRLALRVSVNGAAVDEISDSEKGIILGLAKSENFRVANAAIDLLSACLGGKAFSDLLNVARETKSVLVAKSCATNLALISNGQERWIGGLIDGSEDFNKSAAIIAGLAAAPVVGCVKQLVEYAVQTNKIELREVIKAELNCYRESEEIGPIVETLFMSSPHPKP